MHVTPWIFNFCTGYGSKSGTWGGTWNGTRGGIRVDTRGGPPVSPSGIQKVFM